MEIYLIIIIAWLHFISDFVFQTDYIATNKSTNTNCLLIHSGLYSVPFFILGLEYAVINGLLHFVVDFFTSRLTTYFYMKDNRRMFFLTIGCDQAIHMTCLMLTAGYIRLMF